MPRPAAARPRARFRRDLPALLIALSAALATVPGEHVPGAQERRFTFVDVAAESGIAAISNTSRSPKRQTILDANGNGAAFFDYDNDRDLDLLIVKGSTLERLAKGGDPMAVLYENDGHSRFSDVTARRGLTRRGWGTGVCIADYDNDGFEDVYVTAFGPDVLWRNIEGRTFSAAPHASDARWSTGCAFGDYDRDGHVDLYVANYLEFDAEAALRRGSPSCRFMNIDAFCGPRPMRGEADVLYRNTGNGGFIDVTGEAGVTEPGHYGFGVLFSDVDDDGWPDIYVANDSVPNLLFLNHADGTFSEQALSSGVAVSGDGREQAGMGADAGDYDGDGRLDLVVTNFAQDYTTLYRNLGGGIFADVSFRSGLASTLGPYLGWGVGFVDFDNDGLPGLFISNGHVHREVRRTGTSTYRQRNQIFRNAGGGRFRHVSDATGGGLLVERSSRGAAFGDYDNDGDVDVLVVNVDGPPTLLRNDTPGGHWITVALEGTMSNREAIGAKVTMEAGGRRQIAEVRSGGSYMSHNDVRIHFGLGLARVVDRLEIRWPSGLLEHADRLEVDAFFDAREGSGVRRR